MNRQDAQAIVDSKTRRFRQYKYVSHRDARLLLGEQFAKLLADKIRNLGPAKKSFYPWNVVDHLQMRSVDRL